MKQKRQFKVTGSWGVYDAYKLIRKEKWMDIGRPITEKQFYSIIRRLNKELIEQLLQGRKINLPQRMGFLEVSRHENKAEIKDGKLKITNPIDWGGTLKLWKKDEEARKDKTILRFTAPYTYKIKYSKHNAKFNNKAFYRFTPVRELKLALEEKINNGEIEVLW